MSWFTTLKMTANVPNNRGPLGGKTLEGWFTPQELEAKKGIWPIGDERKVYLVLAKARNRMFTRYGKSPVERFKQMHGRDNFRIEYNKELKKYLIMELEKDYESKPKQHIRRHGGRRLDIDDEQWQAKYGNYSSWGYNQNPPRHIRVAGWEENQKHKKRMQDLRDKDRLSEKNVNEKISGWKNKLWNNKYRYDKMMEGKKK